MNPSVEQSTSYEPRWPAALAIVTLLLLVVNLPTHVKLFPPWFPYGAVGLMLAPMVLVGASKGDSKWIRTERVMVLVVVAIIGIIAIATLSVVIREMLTPSAEVSGLGLLASSVTLWVTNTVVASLLYWQLDRGGPDRRANGVGTEPDWRFPRDDQADLATRPWAPAYVDYLFLAFTTATAFSPTDTVPLTARAKMLMLIQALLSLVTMVVVAARAIGELGP